MAAHSPLPWTLVKEQDGDHIIKDALGRTVHHDTMYYPSGMDIEDAELIVHAVNAFGTDGWIHMTNDPVLDATNEIIAEVNTQVKSGGIHLTVLGMKIIRILDKHKRALAQSVGDGDE